MQQASKSMTLPTSYCPTCAMGLRNSKLRHYASSILFFFPHHCAPSLFSVFSSFSLLPYSERPTLTTIHTTHLPTHSFHHIVHTITAAASSECATKYTQPLLPSPVLIFIFTLPHPHLSALSVPPIPTSLPLPQNVHQKHLQPWKIVMFSYFY